MNIKNVEISNFKTFEKDNVELGMFNVLIGSNASGKSNFLSIIKFLKDITEHGLDNAISMQGGIEYIRNIKIGYKQNLSLGINLCGPRMSMAIIGNEIDKENFLVSNLSNIYYKIELEFYKKSNKYKSIRENLIYDIEIYRVKDIKGEVFDDRSKIVCSGKIIILNENGEGNYKIEFEDEKISKFYKKFIPTIGMKKAFGQKNSKSLLELAISPLIYDIIFSLKDISIYDIDPKLPKVATPIAGKTQLDTDGANLAIALKKILEDKKNSKTFFSVIKDILPIVEKVRVKSGERNLLTNLREIYFKDKFMPAYLISDGTINITALIIALYFGTAPILIEEPERNIHPALISKIIYMMKDVSNRQKKQIITTTHNPEVIRYSGIDNLLFAQRDKEGFTKIYKPGEKENVKKFLNNDLGVSELFIQNLL